jgi:outer membrane protein
MKNFLLTLVLSSMTWIGLAQKVAYIDTKYILGEIPAYNEAQNTLETLSKQWQGEVETLFAEAEKMREAYYMEKILLTEDMQGEREDAIKEKMNEARALQQQYFGPQGELFRKRQELVKPIQDQVFNAVREYADRARLDIIFDKSSDLMMIYADPRYDKSDDILDALGYGY